MKLLELHRTSGSHWKSIADFFPGRTDNGIKNQFFSLVRKSLRKARKTVSKNANTAEVNAIKPKVLSNIISQQLDLPQDLIIDQDTNKPDFKFLATNPVSLQQFIMCFAFGKFSEEEIQGDQKITKAVDYILHSLERQNHEYMGVKSKQKPKRERLTKSRRLSEQAQTKQVKSEPELEVSKPQKKKREIKTQKVENLTEMQLELSPKPTPKET